MFLTYFPFMYTSPNIVFLKINRYEVIRKHFQKIGLLWTISRNMSLWIVLNLYNLDILKQSEIHLEYHLNRILYTFYLVYQCCRVCQWQSLYMYSVCGLNVLICIQYWISQIILVRSILFQTTHTTYRFVHKLVSSKPQWHLLLDTLLN